MSIGTAVPSQEELSLVKHHFIQNVSIKQNYTVGQYLRDFDQQIDNILTSKDIAVAVGGTGLYLKAMLHGLNDFPEVPHTINERLDEIYKEQGLEPLLDILKTKDPVSYQELDHNNPRRILRAVGIIESSGKPFSYFKSQRVDRKLPFTPIVIALVRDREVLYDRINKRVDIMMEQGLLQEVNELVAYKDHRALQTVGYKELFQYLAGDISLAEAVELIKRNTRRYAKRQLTWLRNQLDVPQFHPEDQEKIYDFIESRISQ